MCILVVLCERVTFRSRPEGWVELCHVGKEEKKKAPQAQVTAHAEALKQRTARCSGTVGAQTSVPGAQGVERGGVEVKMNNEEAEEVEKGQIMWAFLVAIMQSHQKTEGRTAVAAGN